MIDEENSFDQPQQADAKKISAVNKIAPSVTPVASPYGQLNLLNDYVVLRNRWEIIQKLFFGGFGEVYLARDIETGEKVAIKVESAKADHPQLPLELLIMKKYQGKKHSLKLYGSGTDGNINFIAMQLAGRNLSHLRKLFTKEKKFSYPTSIRLSIQCVESVRDLHDIGIIHRDIKPSNFTVGRPATREHFLLFLLDFGLARFYVDADGNVKPARSPVGIRGTLRYCSPVTLRRQDLARKDDLISLFYTIFEFFLGDALPWKDMKVAVDILELKEQYTLSILSKCLPDKFVIIAEHIDSLEFLHKPNYELILNTLTSLQKDNGVKLTDPWDWDVAN